MNSEPLLRHLSVRRKMLQLYLDSNGHTNVKGDGRPTSEMQKICCHINNGRKNLKMLTEHSWECSSRQCIEINFQRIQNLRDFKLIFYYRMERLYITGELKLLT